MEFNQKLRLITYVLRFTVSCLLLFGMILLLAFKINSDLKELWITLLVSSLNFCVQTGFKLHKKNPNVAEVAEVELYDEIDGKNGASETLTRSRSRNSRKPITATTERSNSLLSTR